MTVTLTLSAGASLRFSPEGRSSIPGTARSDRKMSFAGRNSCIAAIHTFAETAPVAVETRKSGNLYEMLRVKRNASPMEIKAAYRSLAKMYHPDASSSDDDGRDFIEIRNAYATLSDPVARAMYDLSLSAGSGRRRPIGYSVGDRSVFYPTRRWETDQCW